MRLTGTQFVAFRTLKGRGRGSGGLSGAIAGIAMSLVPLVLVMTVSDGMIRGITERYLETGTYHLQVELPLGHDDPEELRRAVDRIRGIHGVRGVFTETDGGAVIAAPGSTHAAALRSVDPSFYADRTAKALLSFSEGARPPSKPNEILLGDALAENLGVGKGGIVTLMTGVDEPRVGVFRVTGTVSAGYRELDALWAFISPDAGRDFLGARATRSYLGVKIDNPFGRELGAARLEIDAAMKSAFPAWYESGFTRTWQETERGLFGSFATTKAILALVMAIAVLVAAANLGSSLAVFAAERRMETAVLRAMGASQRKVASIFLAAGFATSAIGTLFGIALGMAASWGVNDIIAFADATIDFMRGVFGGSPVDAGSRTQLLDPGFYLQTIPIGFDTLQLCAVAFSSVLLGVMASVLPALRASKMPPMELLRKI